MSFSDIRPWMITVAVVSFLMLLKWGLAILSQRTIKQTYEKELKLLPIVIGSGVNVDESFYNEVEEDFHRHQVVQLGDFAVAAELENDAKNASPIRFGLADDGKIIVSAVDVALPKIFKILGRMMRGKRGLVGVECCSQLDDGTKILTKNAMRTPKRVGTEYIEVEYVDKKTSLEQLLGFHRYRVNEYLRRHRGAKVQVFGSVEEVIAFEEEGLNASAQLFRQNNYQFTKEEQKQLEQKQTAVRVSEPIMAEQIGLGPAAGGMGQLSADGGASTPPPLAQPHGGEAEWYYARGDQQNGPVTLKALRNMFKRNQLNLDHDRVWHPKMPEWLLAGEVEEFQPDAMARAAAEEENETAIFEPSAASLRAASEADYAMGMIEFNTYGGLSRRWFYLWVIVLIPIIEVVPTFFMTESYYDGLSSITRWAAILLFVVVSGSRVRNLGMASGWWWCLLLPIVNIWMYYRCYCCPAGYEDSRQLDTAGKVLTTFYVLCNLLILAVLGMIFFSLGSEGFLESIFDWLAMYEGDYYEPEYQDQFDPAVGGSP
ncbi:DUF4339 domain-containing protein [Persicirhabdus sediminis]|uniref:DUF4339 domain-containing protein n=1 Tax=Persicirhabdus sediminis TaxID=454144 RepID=A0A8J7SH19_9BACT|nr:DUF4339 domain-containing protein [Persicirhabdus sediminis]MBK1790500.1 DUF4339 domain-containing protein [Persicirhabdus sediminis]